MKTSVVDFGAGNMLSVCRALVHCGADVETVATPDAVRAAERLVLPGVGAFGHCMQGLEALDLIDALLDYFATGRPCLGICVGLQVLFATGTEFGEHAGLGWIGGRVEKIFEPVPGGPCLPHIGWTVIRPADGVGAWQGTPLDGIGDAPAVYFVHSFHGQPTRRDDLLAIADYAGVQVTAAVRRGGVIATQFHPEKSGAVGLRILDNFLRMR